MKMEYNLSFVGISLYLLVQWKVEMLIYLLTAEQIYFPNDKTIRNITQTFFIRLLKVFVMISVVGFFFVSFFLYVLLKLAMYSQYSRSRYA